MEANRLSSQCLTLNSLWSQLNIAYKRFRRDWKLNGRLGYYSELSGLAPQESDPPLPKKKLQSVILVSQNNKTAAMLVSQTYPVGVKIFFFFPVKFA